MQYILTGKKNSTTKVVFRYDLRGFLALLEVEGFESEEQLKFLFFNSNFPFPYHEDLIPALLDTGFFKVQQVADDLSFEKFWLTYNLKVSKLKAEKLYNKISKANRIKIFLHLPKYESYLKYKSIEKAYPDTYLRNQKWEDEY